MLSAEIELDFADGEYLFKLKLPQVIELEEKCGFVDRDGSRRKRGVFAIYSDLMAGFGRIDGKVAVIPHMARASAGDAREVIRLGLIGGGRGMVDGKSVTVDAITARKLVERYVDEQPLIGGLTIAASILDVAIKGAEPPKKAEPAKAPARKRPRKRQSTSET